MAFPANMQQLDHALDRNFGAICRAMTHDEARRIIRGHIAQHAPDQADVEIHVRTHSIDGDVGPAYVAHLVDGDDTFTVFLSIEFGCACVAEGKRWPSHWS
jgi:hypothetical protein